MKSTSTGIGTIERSDGVVPMGMAGLMPSAMWTGS